MSIKAMVIMRRVTVAAMSLLIVIPVASLAAKYEGVQIVRYVLKTSTHPKWYRYRDKIQRGVLKYDDEYRRPDYPLGPAQVNCANTRRIGVTFWVKRTGRIMPKDFEMHIVWAHSNVESDDTHLDYYHSHSFHRGQDVWLESIGLELTDELRVNGVLSIRISIGKYEILENSFKLIACMNAP